MSTVRFLTSQQFFLLSSFPQRIPPFLPSFHVTQGGLVSPPGSKGLHRTQAWP